VPPFARFDESVEEEMIEFLDQRVGTFDLYGEIESDDAFVRYCFVRIENAQAFHNRFAAAVEVMPEWRPRTFDCRSRV
jgi:hypothetical protein